MVKFCSKFIFNFSDLIFLFIYGHKFLINQEDKVLCFSNVNGEHVYYIETPSTE